MDALSFTVSSAFGFFQWGKTRGDNRITNLFLSRTEVLGILGAIIGIEGYGPSLFKQKKGVECDPLFYEVLGGLNIAIIPRRHPAFFEDHLIHRHMNEINKKGSLMVKMTGLVNPEYTVVVEKGTCEEEVFRTIQTYLEKGWAEYIPFLGKNQFPLEILEVKSTTLQPVQGKQTIDSLCPASIIHDAPKARKGSIMLGKSYHYIESLKNFKRPGSAEIVNEETVWSSYELTLDQDAYQTDDGKVVAFL